MTHRHRGIFFADAVIGLSIVAALTTVLTIAATAHNRALRALAEQRGAMRVAEIVLINLQAGKLLPAAQEDTTYRVHELKDTPALDGWRWVQVHTTVGKRTISLVGLVPAQKEKS